MIRRRAVVVASATLAASLLATGCVHSRTEVLAAGATRLQPPSGAPVPNVGWDEHHVGDRATTKSGSSVTVRDVAVDRLRNGDRVALVDTEACAPAGRVGATPVSPAYFLVQVADGTSRRPAVGSSRRTPAFPETAVAPGACAHGWITFPLRRGDVVDAVLLASSSFVRWRLAP